MRLRYEITIEDLLAFTQHLHEKSPTLRRTRRAGIIAFAAVMFGMCLIAHELFGDPIVFLFGAGSAGLFAVFHPRLYRRNVKRLTTRLYAEGQNTGILGKHIAELRENGLSDTTDFSERTVFWKGIERIETIPGHTLVYLSAMSAQVIPENSVVEGSYSAFVEELQRRWHHARGDSPYCDRQEVAR